MCVSARLCLVTPAPVLELVHVCASCFPFDCFVSLNKETTRICTCCPEYIQIVKKNSSVTSVVVQFSSVLPSVHVCNLHSSHTHLLFLPPSPRPPPRFLKKFCFSQCVLSRTFGTTENLLTLKVINMDFIPSGALKGSSSFPLRDNTDNVLPRTEQQAVLLLEKMNPF